MVAIQVQKHETFLGKPEAQNIKLASIGGSYMNAAFTCSMAHLPGPVW
jgi:hypothetical protein